MADSPRAGRILITPRSLTLGAVASAVELEPLIAAGYELVSAPAGRTPTQAELLELVPGCVGWLAGVENIPASVIAAATELRVIARNGVGTDSIDMSAASLAGVAVTTAAGANAQGVAELAVTLALSCLRQVPWSAASVRAGGWERFPARELSEVTVGVVGLGAIGHRVATAFGALGAHVVGFDPFSSAEGIRRMELDELLALADVVTLHAPPPEDGSALIDSAQLALMREGAVLVNTARASLVDDDAVLAALESGRLSAYAVDAFATEPPELTPLLRHDRVIATPHIGAFTGASVRRATTMAVESLMENL
ncbi:phosphoglycerate dehydrogenase [soil metagenome]